MDAILNVIAILIILALPYVIYSFIKGGNKSEEKRLEVFTVPWDELLRCFDYSFMPGERDDTMDEVLASDKLAADLDKLEKAERDKAVKALEQRYPVLKAVELTNHGVEFTFCHTKKTQEAQPAELAELRAKKLALIEKHYANARQGKITTLEACENVEKEDDSGIKVKTLDENFIFWFFGSSFGLKAWRMPDSWPEGWGDHRPAISRKITKVELTNDGVEFTTVRV